jgi:outer membrane immunogenic protein
MAMSRTLMTAAFVVLLIGASASADAQPQWTGPYVGGFAGAILQNGDDSEEVEFDTDLDEDFGDTVRNVGGADVFSPGFCAGLATGPTPSADCDEDEDGFVLGGRVGYDWMTNGLVVGVVGDVAWPEATDSVSAFSTAPAFYAFTRELNTLAGLRVRVGAGGDRLIAYGTAGFAFGWIEHTFVTSSNVNSFVAINRDDDDDDDGGDGNRDGAAGYQVGGGLEWWIAERLTLSAEYLFTSLDDRDDGVIRAQGPAPAGNPFLLGDPDGTDLRRSDRFGVHALTVGLNFRF